MTQVSNQNANLNNAASSELRNDYEAARAQLQEQFDKISPQIKGTLKEYGIEMPQVQNGDIQLSKEQRSEIYATIRNLRPKYDAKGGDNPNLAAIQLIDNLVVADASLDEVGHKLNDKIPDDKQNIRGDLSSATRLMTDVEAIAPQLAAARKNEAGRMGDLASAYNYQRQRLGEMGQQYNQRFGQLTGFNFSANGQISDAQGEKIRDRLKNPNASAEEKMRLNVMLQADQFLDRVPQILSQINTNVANGNFVQTPQLRAKAAQEIKNAQTFTLSNYEK